MPFCRRITPVLVGDSFNDDYEDGGEEEEEGRTRKSGRRVSWDNSRRNSTSSNLKSPYNEISKQTFVFLNYLSFNICNLYTSLIMHNVLLYNIEN